MTSPRISSSRPPRSPIGPPVVSLRILLSTLAALAAFALGAADAAAQSYVSAEIPWSWTNISGTGTRLPINTSNGATTLPLPFEVPFWGRPVSTITVTSEGYAILGPGTPAYTPAVATPNVANPNGIVAPFWSDLDASAAGSGIFAQTLNTGAFAAPNRRFVVQWDRIPFTGTGTLNTFQLIIHEGTGFIEYRIDLGASGRNHVVGIERETGASGLNIDVSSTQIFQRAWMLQGDVDLIAPDCGSDAHYDCYQVPFEFDSVIDEIFLPPDYYVELDYAWEWQDIPLASRIVVDASFTNINFVESTGAIATPFPVRFYENTYNSIYINDSGGISFQAPFLPNIAGWGAGWPADFPTPGFNTDTLAAPAWAWWTPERCGEVFYGTLGPVGNRRFVVTWNGVCHWVYAVTNNASLSATATFQIVFYEATGEVRFNYNGVDTFGLAQNLNALGFSSAYAHTAVGLEDATATRGTNIVGSDIDPDRDTNIDENGDGFVDFPITLISVGQYTYRMVYRNQPMGVGRRVFPTPFQIDPSCQDAVAAINAGDGMFPFSYYEQPNTSTVYMTSNGLLGFVNSGLDSFTPAAFPNVANPNAIVSPAWTDLLPCGGGEAAFTFRTGPGGRQLVTQWSNIPQEIKIPPSDVAWVPNRLTSAQTILNQSSNVIQLNVLEVELRDFSTYEAALSIGLENYTGTEGINVLFAASGDRFVNTSSWKFVPSCGPTVGTACANPVGGIGACGVTGIVACVAGAEVCLPSTFPTTEVCDGVDNDCDGTTDEGVRPRWYLDDDGDNYGDNAISVLACTQPPGFVADSTDCDDTNAAINPGATEICDYIDNDCDTLIDEGLRQMLYSDNDGDGFGAGMLQSRCPGVDGSPNNLDCNDTNAAINPNATEVCDGADNDCDTVVDDSPSDVGQACVGPGTGLCSAGTTRCVGGVVVCDTPSPSPELCDGFDNDCDGTLDEVSDAPNAHRNPGIALYAPFDDDSGTTIVDIAGAPNPGTAFGNPTHPAGRYEEGLHLTVNQYVTFADSPNAEIDLRGTSAFTLALWVNSDVLTPGNRADILSRAGQLSFFTQGTIPSWRIQGVTYNLPAAMAGRWYHYAVIHTGSEARFYVNGVRVSTVANALGAWAAPTGLFTLGTPTPANAFMGILDEVILWRYAIDEPTIQGIASAANGAPPYSVAGDVYCETGQQGICSLGRTRCTLTGQIVCGGPPPGPLELCNNLDDDCDGMTDEGNNAGEMPFGAGGSGSCMTGQPGICMLGRLHCVGGMLSCLPVTPPSIERCDGRDNNCNGSIDESDPQLGDSCPTGLPGICSDGTLICGTNGLGMPALVCAGPDPGDNDETCNGLDDDCDTAIDEGNPAGLTPNGTTLEQACGCFNSGTQECILGEWSRCNARLPQSELCDNEDNDCDGSIDEGIARRCTSDCGEGVEFCMAGSWGGCSAPDPDLEVCDGRDNDCNGDIDDGLNCGCRIYPAGGLPQVQQAWRWAPSAAMPMLEYTTPTGTPLVGALTDTNGDGAANANDTPRVLVMTASTNDPTRGILRVLRGDDGALISTNGNLVLAAAATPAIAELNNGVRADIAALVHPISGGGVALIEATGGIDWHNTEVNQGFTADRGALAVGNVITGTPLGEIAGCHWLVAADGTTLWNLPAEPRTPFCSPVLADLDDDGDLEVIIGGKVYDGDGTLFWTSAPFIAANGGVADAPAAVADLDNNGTPEVILVSQRVYVLDGATGAILASAALPGTGRGGAPHIADLNLDGSHEIVVANTDRLSVLRYVDTGVTRAVNAVWSFPIQDGTTGIAAATSIDLNNDGKREVLFNDELYFRIFDADGGLIQEIDGWGRRDNNIPIVADVNGDNEANILVIFNALGTFYDDYIDGNHAFGLPNRVELLEGDGLAFPQTGRAWNEHSHHVTNILPSMRAPLPETHHWSDPDTHVFRANIVTNAAMFNAPDLTLSIIDLQQGEEIMGCPALNRLTVEACNIGEVDVPAGVKIRLTLNPEPDPMNPFEVIVTIPVPLPHTAPNNCRVETIDYLVEVEGFYTVNIALDSDNVVAECRENNNMASLPFVYFAPPAAEVCNGIDDDCNGAIDDNAGAPLSRACGGVCGGNQECVNGVWGACSSPPAAAETCNGIDDDCDGTPDDLPDACDGRTGVSCRCADPTKPETCACIEVLTVDECGAGCPLGSICGAEGTCIPYCYDDYACPDAHRCVDHVCAPSAAANGVNPDADGAPTSAGGCSTGTFDAAGGSAPLALLLLAAAGVFIALRRR